MVGNAARMEWKQPFILSVTISSNSSGVVCTPVFADRAGAAGDIDKNVDAPAERRLGLLRRGLALLGLREIAGNDDHLAALGFHLGGNRLNRRGIAAQQRQLAALFGKGVGDGGAHTAWRGL